MKSHLSHILPVYQACHILGEPVVYRMVSSLLYLRQNSTNRNNKQNNRGASDGDRAHQEAALEEEIETLVQALFYQHPPPREGQQQQQQQSTDSSRAAAGGAATASSGSFPSASASSNNNNGSAAVLPPVIAQSWKKWLTSRPLALEKSALIQFLVPVGQQPHSGPHGHQGLFDCLVYALQGRAVSSSSASYYGGASNPLVHIPDVIILLAVCKQYRNFQQEQEHNRQISLMQQQQEQQRQQEQEEGNFRNGKDGDDEDGKENKRGDESEKKKKDTNEEEEKDDTNSTAEHDAAEFKDARATAHEADYVHVKTELDNEDHPSGNAACGKSEASCSTIAEDEDDYDLVSFAKDAVYTMSLMAYRIYDSYQKKGIVTRDTVHRFLTDILGEESYKIPSNQAVLDDLFRDSKHPTGWLHVTVSEQQFCKRILDRMMMTPTNDTSGSNDNNNGANDDNNDGAAGTAATAGNKVLSKKQQQQSMLIQNPSHLLLDWIAVLCTAMVPLPEIPETVSAYLETMHQPPRPVCSVYQLADTRLFEIKRRFHSMVAAANNSSAAVIQGDPMSSEPEQQLEQQQQDGEGSSGGGASAAAAPSAATPSTASAPLQQPQQPHRHAISLAAFCEAVCTPNEEMGNGGFLPISLAKLVFRAGYRLFGRGGGSGSEMVGGSAMAVDDNVEVGEDEWEQQDMGNSSNDYALKSPYYWGLYHVLQFGCMAVRRNCLQKKAEDPDIPVLRFLFGMFQVHPPANRTATTAAAAGESGLASSGGSENASRIKKNRNDVVLVDKRVLTRWQVTQMILSLLQYTAFRKKADSPPTDDDDDDDNYDGLRQKNGKLTVATFQAGKDRDNLEDASVDIDLAAALGILPRGVSVEGGISKNKRSISVKALVDATLKDVSTPDQMTFDEFCRWNQSQQQQHAQKSGSSRNHTSSGGGAGVMTMNDGGGIGKSTGMMSGSSSTGSSQQQQSHCKCWGLVTELRLIASVLFGIPTTAASMEVAMIRQVERRHAGRYPQTAVSRRGPRGTVWYLMDATWFKQWWSRVQQVAGTPEDVRDGRQEGAPFSSATTARGLGRISNTALLAENGSLALRADHLRWHVDYEIVPPLAWSAYQAWYDGGPPIYRTVVKYVPTAVSSSSSSASSSSGGSNLHASPHSNKPRIPTEHEIELYPLHVTVYLCDAASRGEARPFLQNCQFSRVSPARVMLVQLCKELQVDPDRARLWVLASPPGSAAVATSGTSSGGGGGGRRLSSGNNSSSLEMEGSNHYGRQQQQASADDSTVSPSNTSGVLEDWILNLDMNIVEQRKRRSQHHNNTNNNNNNSSSTGGSGTGGGLTLLLELKDKETGKWPRGIDGREWAFREQSAAEQGGLPGENDLGDGVVGLYNMGNTCYLNSSIQCLSHTPIFREYFTTKAYLMDVNTTNPLGHQGQLAQVSAVLINSLWKRFQNSTLSSPHHMNHHKKRVTTPGSYALISAPSLTPKTFKESLGKFNEHFSGNEQHDAQEMLAFLLGGLSEDLNRIVDKPYIEAPDSDGRLSDAELADIWWSNHLQREMSIIVALFTGQYKSLLTCRSCKYESARFEPFTFLQLPLPEDDHLSVYLVLHPLQDGVDTMKYCVRVRSDGKLRDVLIALAKLLHDGEQQQQQQITASDTTTAASETVAAKAQDGAQKATTAQDDDETNDADDVYIRRSQNLAVVDMRDGYILKIAPNTWSLQDLQIKDTGELPMLHVYELEPVAAPDDPAVDESSTRKNSNANERGNAPTDDDEQYSMDEDELEDDDEPKTEQRKASFVAVAQRRSELTSRDYLHPLAHRVFGTPLLLRINDLPNLTGREFYDLVARRLRNVVPRSALRFLTDQSSLLRQQSSDSNDETQQQQQQQRESAARAEQQLLPPFAREAGMTRTMTDTEEVSAGSVPRYGFRLRVTTREGRRCLICPWFECCIGCLVSDDDNTTIVMDGDSIVVDWHFAVDVATCGFGSRCSPTDPVISSSQPVAPVRTRAAASFGVHIKNHSSCGTGTKKGCAAGAITLEDCLDAFAQEERIPEAYCSKCKDFRVQTKRMSLWRLPPVVIIHLKRFQFTQHMRRKLRDLVIFPVEGLDLSRIMAHDSESAVQPSTTTTTGSAKVKHDSKENGETDTEEEDNATETDDTEVSENATNGDQIKDTGRSERLYDLYGVVHHQGALSGGHYVASLKSELDGQWRLFNDAQIFEIHSRDVVDSSAYILFYIRRDVCKGQLSDFWDIRESNISGLSGEDMDQLLKARSDRCVIS